MYKLPHSIFNHIGMHNIIYLPISDTTLKKRQVIVFLCFTDYTQVNISSFGHTSIYIIFPKIPNLLNCFIFVILPMLNQTHIFVAHKQQDHP